MTEERDIALINDFRKSASEVSYVEFKEGSSDAITIGKYISALSNAARISDKNHGYLIWGIKNHTHDVIKTKFNPLSVVYQEQPLEFWLSQRLNPCPQFEFRQVNHPEGRLVFLEISAAASSPVEFDRVSYIRIGSSTPRLSDYPERLRALWTKLQPYIWEEGVAKSFLTPDEVIRYIDYPAYFELSRIPLPTDLNRIIERLNDAKLIQIDAGDRYNITNLGAILFSKNLSEFDRNLRRKAVRFTAYHGDNRASPVTHTRDGQKGYANGFNGLIDYINGILPQNEHIGKAFRTEIPLYPEIALRELIANALIHQDMTISGAGPSVELFSNRIEITNPGKPLIDPERFIDSAPRSRNEALADLMRRVGLCEERGSGIDKVITAVELFQLPPPDFRQEDGAMRVVLFAPRRFIDMTVAERLRACYQHTVLKFISGDAMRNASLRERLGIEEHNKAQVSQIITKALSEKIIKPIDPQKPRSGYLPIWA